MKVIGAEDPVITFIGNSREEAQAFVLDEDVIFGESKGVKAKKIDDDLINGNSAEGFNKIKKAGNRNVATLRNCCVISKDLLQKIVPAGAKMIDKMGMVVIGWRWRGSLGTY